MFGSKTWTGAREGRKRLPFLILQEYSITGSGKYDPPINGASGDENNERGDYPGGVSMESPIVEHEEY